MESVLFYYATQHIHSLLYNGKETRPQDKN